MRDMTSKQAWVGRLFGPLFGFVVGDGNAGSTIRAGRKASRTLPAMDRRTR